MADFEPKQFGKYYLLEKLAVGGMAEIYKAKTFGVDGFEKELAIKRILPHCSADKDFITMLIDEAKLSVMLSHANIVQVYDLGKVGDDYFISMEFIHGVNLRDIMYRCRENKVPIPTDVAVYIVSEMCKGLDYAHRKTDQNIHHLNIVHRDISPQNVLISYEGEVKIVDFGIAKAAMNISHTMAGILKGKIAYMSPEQAMGKTIDKRTDIFSTGILFFELITGTKLFTGESQFEILKKIRTTHVDAAGLPDSVPAALKPILAKALAYNPDERYQFAGDLQIELTKFLYSTYSDFSPRRLSSFIRETFTDILKKDRPESPPDEVIERQTSSMNFVEGAKQLEIVHRDTSSFPPKEAKEVTIRANKNDAIPDDTLGNKLRRKIKEPTVKQSQPAGRSFSAKKNTRSIIAALITLILLIGAGFAVYQIIPVFMTEEETLPLPPLPPPPPVVETGTLNIITDPPGAAVLLDGKITGLTTPATLEELPLNKDLKIVITKPDYEDLEQVISLTTPKPQRISTKLTPVAPPTPPPVEEKPVEEKPVAEKVAIVKKATLRITSKPDGARIMLDGKYLGQKTPATVSDLNLGSTYNIRLDLSGYKAFSRKKSILKETEALYAALLKEEKVEETKPAASTKPEDVYGEVILSSNPPRAQVIFDGHQIPTPTPVTVRKVRRDKPHTITVQLPGYKSWSTSFTLKEGNKTFNATLKPE